MGRLPLLQGSASSIAEQYDLLFWAVTLNALFFSLLIFGGILVLSVVYRRGNRVDRSRAPIHNNLVEVVWTVVPLGIAMGLFVWATVLYFQSVRVPAGAMQIHVVGKQWMWKLQHPSGRWENNELHVPAGRPVVLTMTSEDVIHSFFVPAFRLKQDVIPGQFTQMWFTATKPGTYPLFCAEFCGTLHSGMTGLVHVMEPADYDRWLTSGNIREIAAQEGARLFIRHGCNGCHGADASVRAPALEGIYGKPIPIQVPKPGVPLERTPATTIIADTRYIHDSILLPDQEIAAGFQPVMSTFKGQLTEEEVLKLVAYIRSLADKRRPEAGRQDTTGTLSPGVRQNNTGSLSEDDFRARTGFVPKNMRQIEEAARTRPSEGTGGGSERMRR